MVKTATGKQTTTINQKPKLNENDDFTAVVSWVSMNPPTKNHEKLVAEMQAYAGDHILFLERNDKFPLSYATRLECAQTIFPEIVEDHNFNDLIEAMASLSRVYKNIIVLADEMNITNIEEEIQEAKENGSLDVSYYSVVSNNIMDVERSSVNGVRRLEIKEAFLNGDTDILENVIPETLHSEMDNFLSEALNVAQRVKRGNSMRRREAVLKNARKRVMNRHAEKSRLEKRSRKEAINKIKMKLAGGRSTDEMSYGDKARVEDILKTKKGAIKNLSRRLLNKVRDRENARHSGK